MFFTSIPLLTFSPNSGKQSFKRQVLRTGNMSEAPGLGPYQGWTDLLSNSPWEIFLTASEFDPSFPQLLNQDTWVFSDYLLNICQVHSLLSTPTKTTLCWAPSLYSLQWPISSSLVSVQGCDDPFSRLHPDGSLESQSDPVMPLTPA